MIPQEFGELARGENMSEEQAGELMEFLIGGSAQDGEIGDILSALSAKGETADEIAGMAKVALARGVRVEAGNGVLDTCGTGGDNLATFNISTLAALVAASAGAKVVKHGGRAASGKCGSADVLEALGVEIALGPQGVVSCLEEVGIAFCFAPNFNPAFKHVGPARKRLGKRTIFNFLGPLLNPAGASYRSLGVCDERMRLTLAEVLAKLEVERAIVYRALDGMDELSLAAPTLVIEMREGRRWEYQLEASQLGLMGASVSALAGGDAQVNAQIARQVLNGEGGPRRDVVLLNAAAALRVAGVAQDWRGALGTARDALDRGLAGDLLVRWVAASQRSGSNT